MEGQKSLPPLLTSGDEALLSDGRRTHGLQERHVT